MSANIIENKIQYCRHWQCFVLNRRMCYCKKCQTHLICEECEHLDIIVNMKTVFLLTRTMYTLSWLRPCPLTSSSLVTFHFLVHHHHHPQQYHRRHLNFCLTTSQLIINNLSLPIQPSLKIATLFFFQKS